MAQPRYSISMGRYFEPRDSSTTNMVYEPTNPHHQNCDWLVKNLRECKNEVRTEKTTNIWQLSKSNKQNQTAIIVWS